MVSSDSSVAKTMNTLGRCVQEAWRRGGVGGGIARALGCGKANSRSSHCSLTLGLNSMFESL